MNASEIKQLLEDLQSRVGSKRAAARKELVRLGEEAIPHLNTLVESKKHKTRWEAVKALGEIGSSLSIETMIHALEDEKSDVRWLAAEGLIQIGFDVMPFLLDTLEAKYKSMHVRYGAHHVMREFDDYDLGEEYDELMYCLEKFINIESIPILVEKLKTKIKNR